MKKLRLLFAKTPLTFESACKTTLEKELAAKQTKQVHASAEEIGKVNAVGNRKTSTAAKVYRSRQEKGSDEALKCYRCGRGHERDKCRYKKYRCNTCFKTGHLQVMCRTSQQRHKVRAVEMSDDESNDIEWYTVFFRKERVPGYSVTVASPASPVEMKLPYCQRIYTNRNSLIPCKPTSVSLKAYTGGK